MEVLAKVELAIDDLRRVVGKHRGCLAWGGSARLSPADDILISVERPLGIDSQGQMVASILSEKLAAGSTDLLIDIPVGPSAKVRQMPEALRLRKLFEFVGDQLGLHLDVIATDGRQPIGRGIGPLLEARDVMQALQNDPQAPSDLRQKGLRLAGRVLEFSPDVRGGQGFALAPDILDSGRALSKMNAIIAQSPRSNLQMARIARFAGAPMEKGSGVDLLKKLGDVVSKGEPLYRVYAKYPADFQFASP
jgi:thymidine phosphorylase